MPEDNNAVYNAVFTELKRLGVKVPKVKKFKALASKQEKTVQQSKSKIFGVCLCHQEWTTDEDFPNITVPKFIASSIAYLRDFIATEGLFRKAGSIVRQRDLRLKLEKGERLDGSEPNDVASLLKQWLRELPEPLIPSYMHDLYMRCQHLETSECRITANLLVCLLLPRDHLLTLRYLLLFLSDFAEHSIKNQMNHRNLALVIAPNIFVTSADSTDKASPELAQLHISILELLIKNATKVGVMSPSIQQCMLESCSELDSSGDILDSSPCKSRKKRRSGPVQDIFNGIKKLVGQTATPAPKSASKRKAETNDGSLPKKLTVEVNGERISCETPKNKRSKLPHTDGKIAGGRVRKKSFGLLRRKRQKSNQSPQPKVSPSSKSPLSWNFDVKIDKANNSLQLPDLPSPVSPFDFFNADKALKSDSIKKSTSDCYLIVPSTKITTLYSSASQGHLQNLSKTTPYNLRTKIEGNQSSQMQSLESIQLEMKNIIDDTVSGNKSSLQQNVNPGSPIFSKSAIVSTKLRFDTTKELEAIPKKTASCESNKMDTNIDGKVLTTQEKSFRRAGSRRKINRTHSRASESLKVKEISVQSDAKSLLSETLLELDSKLSNKGNFKTTHTNLNMKPEALNVKVDHQKQKNTHGTNNIRKSHENASSKKDIQLRKAQSVNLGSKSHNKMSIKKEKTTRNGSIIRGRPNTVKSGLPSDACQRFNNDSISIPTDDLIDSTFHLASNHLNKESPQNKYSHGIELNNNPDTSDQEKISPLNLKFQKFTLTSPPGSGSKLIKSSKSDQNLNFSVFDDSSSIKQSSKHHLKIALDASQKRKLSLPSFEENARLSTNTNTSHLRKSLDAATRKCSLNRVSLDLKRKSSSNLSDKKSEVPIKTADSLKDLSIPDLSMNDSCFKTPNKIASPDSFIWMSGKKFLDANFPHSEEKFNKRESIAMILKSNPGHVQSKVHLWDTKVRESVYQTKSVPSCSTPADLILNEMFQRSNSQKYNKPMSVSKRCKSTNSSKKNLKRLPVPPPPKFFPDEPNTPSPSINRPLKEVTNISLWMNESKNSLNSSKDEFGLLDASLENLVPKSSQKKVARKSFNDGTPKKSTKRVSRSESSPCPRPMKRTSRAKLMIGIHSTELEDKLIVPTKRFLRSTSKSGSCLSIEKLRSDQMTDEWHCEM